MGKLNIIGKAEKQVPCNAMEIFLTFSTYEATAARAAEKIMQNCDDFLTMLQKNHADISDISIEEVSTEKSYAKKTEYYAVRKIKLRFDFDMSLLNQFDIWTQQAQYDVTLESNFYLSNLAEIRKELLKEAVEDSRQKAEMLAEMMGQKITGFEEVIMDRDFRNDDIAVACACAENVPRAKSISNVLKAPEKTESERVEVIWNIE